MSTTESKNKFVLELRDYLMRLYGTNSHYTCGEDDFEGQKIGEGFVLIQRDLNKPRDIIGFYFRRHLCLNPPKDETTVLKEILDFSKRRDIGNMVERGNYLKMEFENREYLVMPFVDKLYAGKISVCFSESLGSFVRKQVRKVFSQKR